ncbi:MAG: hypothetical protein GWP04_05775 [Gammaproteobacteria bacterium]|nr:hypothetical protein [Gammaproteobacteria bacterium]
MRKKTLLVVVGLIVGGVAAAVIARGQVAQPQVDKMARLDVVIGSSAIVEAHVESVNAPKRVPETDFTVYVDQVLVERVLFVAKSPSTFSGGPFPVPSPPTGRVLMTELAGDAPGVPGGSRIPSHFEGLDPAESVILLLGYRPVVGELPETRLPEAARGTPWHIGNAAVVRDGKLEFLGPNGGWMTEQFSWVVQPGEDPVDVLVTWVAEKDAERLGAPPGPISQRFAAARREHDAARADLWRQTPVEHRLLDPEETPSEEFAKLVETNVVVEVDPAARRDDMFLVVRTPFGLAHAARLSGGNHPAPVFTRPGDPWEVIIARDEWGNDTVPSEQWEGAVGVLLRVTPEAVAALGDPSLAPVDGIAERFDDMHDWIAAVYPILED